MVVLNAIVLYAQNPKTMELVHNNHFIDSFPFIPGDRISTITMDALKLTQTCLLGTAALLIFLSTFAHAYVGPSCRTCLITGDWPACAQCYSSKPSELSENLSEFATKSCEFFSLPLLSVLSFSLYLSLSLVICLFFSLTFLSSHFIICSLAY